MGKIKVSQKLIVANFKMVNKSKALEDYLKQLVEVISTQGLKTHNKMVVVLDTRCAKISFPIRQLKSYFTSPKVIEVLREHVYDIVVVPPSCAIPYIVKNIIKSLAMTTQVPFHVEMEWLVAKRKVRSLLKDHCTQSLPKANCPENESSQNLS